MILTLLLQRLEKLEREISTIQALIRDIQQKFEHKDVEKYTLHTSDFIICKECGYCKNE